MLTVWVNSGSAVFHPYAFRNRQTKHYCSICLAITRGINCEASTKCEAPITRRLESDLDTQGRRHKKHSDTKKELSMHISKVNLVCAFNSAKIHHVAIALRVNGWVKEEDVVHRIQPLNATAKPPAVAVLLASTAQVECQSLTTRPASLKRARNALLSLKIEVQHCYKK